MGHRLHKHTAEQQHHGKSNAQHITGIENMIEYPRRQIPQQQYRADGEKRNLNKNHLIVFFFNLSIFDFSLQMQHKSTLLSAISA